MIGFISGTLVEKSPSQVIVENGGMGILAAISYTAFQSLPKVGEKVKLLTHLYVREDQLTLYGFLDPEERELFETLISISGIGPRGAMKILSGISPRRFSEAVATEDVDYLTKLPGIGKKSAQRLIVELREKLPALTREKEQIPGLAREKSEEVMGALGALGLSNYESRRALEKATQALGAERAALLSTEELIRETLKAGR